MITVGDDDLQDGCAAIHYREEETVPLPDGVINIDIEASRRRPVNPSPVAYGEVCGQIRPSLSARFNED